MALNTDKRYHIQVKRTKLSANNEKIEYYPLVFGEPVYLQNDERLVIGEAPEEGYTTTNISDCSAVKLVSQNLEDPDDSEKHINVVENGVYYKNRDTDDTVDTIDNSGHKIYPKTKLTAIQNDNGLRLDELLLRKVNIDKNTQVAYPSLGYDDTGVYVHEFTAEESGTIPQTVVDIVNKKVSIDDNSAVALDLALGVDLGGIYVTIPPEEAKDLTYVQAYIDAQLNDMVENRVTALEGNIFYLQETLKNFSPYHRGSMPPTDKNKFWIDTASVTGGLKYCSNRQNNSWSHVAVAYT